MRRPAIETRTQEDRHWWFASRTRALLGLLDDACVDRARATGVDMSWGDLRVLDVGCGAGNMVHHLQRYGRVVGVDSFNRPLGVAQGRGYAVGQATGEALPFPDRSFDLVAVLDVVEHCDDDARVLRECGRILADGGLLALTTPAFPWLWSDNDAINGHRRRYSVAELSGVLRAAGFQIRRLTCNNFFVFPLAAGLIVLRNLRGQRLRLAAPATDADAYQVEMQPAHPVANTVLGTVGVAEAALLRRVTLPIGTGLIAIAQKGRTSLISAQRGEKPAAAAREC